MGDKPNKVLIVLFSYHNKNTEKVAIRLAKILDAKVKTPLEISPEELSKYDLVGFGSGIYSAKHHGSILDLADRLPQITGKKAFIFSTDGAPRSVMKNEQAMRDHNHSSLKTKLISKGYEIAGEFSCAGFNTNSFLKFFGGLNKGRPNKDDLKYAEDFALDLKERCL